MVGARARRDPEPLGDLEDRRPLEHGAVLEQRDGQAFGSTPAMVSSSRASSSRSTSSQRAGTRLRARKSRRSCDVLREAMADHADAAGLERGARLPGREEILETGKRCSSGGSHGFSR